jgi:exonuclease SbcC
MRPLELRIRNFRSYAGEHSFDFRDRTLVGIVGPIGSGKSSILDAISFALYGRTSRIGSATRSLINQRSADSSVSLRFVVEGELWEAARSIRVKGQSKHALYRYDRDDPDAEPVEKLLMESEVNERIVDILGLDFSAFERSVLLAQGRFAEFLQARPVDRDKVLKGVFGHDRIDRMKVIAKEQRDAAAVELDKLAARLDYFDQLRKRLEQQTVELGELRKQTKALEDAAAKVSQLDAEVKDTSAQVDDVAKRLAVLEEHAGRLPDGDATDRTLAEASAATKRRDDLATVLQDAQTSLKAAEQSLADSVAAGEPENLQHAAELLAAAEPQTKSVMEADDRVSSMAERVEAARTAVGVIEEKLVTVEQQRDQALGRSAEAARILEDAEAALLAERHADMAAALRANLEAGEPCPVCGQLVHEIPESKQNGHVAELEQVVASASTAREEVDAAHTGAIAAFERTREQLQSAMDQVVAAEAQMDGARKDALRARGDFEETSLRLEKILGPGDPGDLLEERRRRQDSLVAARDDAQRAVDKTRSSHDQAIRDEQEASKALQELGVRLTELATRLDTDIEIGDDPESLGKALRRLRRTWEEETAELRETRQKAESRLKETMAGRRQILDELGVGDDISTAAAVASDRLVRLEERIESNEKELADAGNLYEEREVLADRVEVFGRINSDLTDSRFIRFLLDDERSRLAELGSEHFQRLSAGRYRFADDHFAIVDLAAADATRRADSLSGGETFLASLGLAIALAEMVAGTGGRLDAFFLDEGFGTLDPEHLDLAMEGVERLVADNPDRLVVIVSHVPELRLRIGDLIELERNAVTGDTHVISS